MNQLLAMQLWHLSKYTEFTEIARQKDYTFIKLLNSVFIHGISYISDIF